MFQYYRDFRLSKLNEPKFSHIKLLLFWPLYGLLFLILERFLPRVYHTMYCPWDDLIPFCEYFVFPYLFWFVFLIGFLVYLFFYDIPGFRKSMQFIIFTYSAACLIFLLFPTQQELRPEVFPRDNFLTRFMAWFYTFDTNTNVCPSLHVVGSLAVLFAAWHSPKTATPLWRTLFSVTAFLICISTVFLKQHSLLDLPPAVLLSAVGYVLVYKPTFHKESHTAALEY